MCIKKTFASNLLFLREREGWTLDQVARKLGINISRYQHWERGRVLPQSPQFLITLSDMYGVTIDDLLKTVMVKA
ncbi:helix-turn-helix transcriptional regulator [Chitinophaga niabensis]|uniref:helix-turn-helix domain-containing protein n=1 Tax=Chitinophaga niabensis TaxID=536979 RepID=UPI0031B9C4DA